VPPAVIYDHSGEVKPALFELHLESTRNPAIAEVLYA